MSEAHNHDLSLKLRMRRLLFSQGYWTPIEVELSQYEHLGTVLKRRSLTDLDVLGVKVDPLLTMRRIVADCKTGKNVSDANRLFWLRGVMDYFGGEEAYFLRPKMDKHARAIAPKIGLRVLDEDELAVLEKVVGADAMDLPLADVPTHLRMAKLWGIDVARGAKPDKDQLILKKAYSHLAYSYWYTEPHRNLLALVARFEEAAHLFSKTDERLLLLAYAGAERFAHCLLDIACHVQAQGASDVQRYARTYLFGGPVALCEKEQLFELLRKTTGTTEFLDPPWLAEVLEALNRLVRNPGGACDVLRYLTAIYMWCVLMGRAEAPNVNGTGANTAALVLAKDVAFSFAKATGLPQSVFAAMNPL